MKRSRYLPQIDPNLDDHYALPDEQSVTETLPVTVSVDSICSEQNCNGHCRGNLQGDPIPWISNHRGQL
jgi:hypothetical protein